MGRHTYLRDQYSITAVPTDEPRPTAVFVSDAVAEAASPELAALAAEEATLGDLRNCPSVREGGDHPEVDDLYRRLNAKIVDVKTDVARRVVPLVADVVTGPTGDLSFSVNAGCEMCRCSPGVVARGLRRGGVKVDLFIDAG